MGLTVLSLEVANAGKPQQAETVEFLIDSGAIYSVVPRPILERLGIGPPRTKQNNWPTIPS